MDENLKEALEAIKLLRATLHLAYFDRANVDVNEVDGAMNTGRGLLEKHGETDDMMDVDFAEKHGRYPQEDE